ncbi:unnamed protein product [Effrenium voratum]|nr:unnamed protein product [Effrenium voratum]
MSEELAAPSETSRSELDAQLEAGHSRSRRENRARNVEIAGGFFRNASRIGTEKVSTQEISAPVGRLRWLLQTYAFANFMGVVVFADGICTCAEINSRAARTPVEPIYATLADVCLTLYTLEIMARTYVFGREILSDWVTAMDLAVVICGWVEVILNAVAADSFVRVSMLRAVRLVRILRPIRLLKRIRMLRELHKLTIMMATCFRTLLWSFLLCFVVMTGWAMLMVEVVYPVVRELNEKQGLFEDCPQCMTATSSVMEANLLLFKTVIAGDSWGELAVPVIQAHPATAFIFIGSLLTLVFGVLNLIVAVVVDTFADARLNDVEALAEEIEDEIDHDKKNLEKLFKRIDKEGSGQLTVEGLKDAARNDALFQSRLRVMDIDENDLQQLFQMIDKDQSGTIEVSEFIGPLSRWAYDSKTAPRFIKYNLLQTMSLQEDLFDFTADGFMDLNNKLDFLANKVQIWSLARRAQLLSSHSTFDHGAAEPAVQKACSTEEADLELPDIAESHTCPIQLKSMNGTQSSEVDSAIADVLAKIEAKMELVLAEVRGRASKEPTLSRESSMRFRSHRGRPRPRIRLGFNEAAFQNMYLEPDGKSLGPSRASHSPTSTPVASWIGLKPFGLGIGRWPAGSRSLAESRTPPAPRPPQPHLSAGHDGQLVLDM